MMIYTIIFILIHWWSRPMLLAFSGFVFEFLWAEHEASL